ncbi:MULTISPECIES: class I SAM-dependent methyltransferase [Pectobacterium]|uniref:class I SAM-dependent methyltransferase n=1 Tax=Pectobacterium TaxID=122277 RepID=UPI001CF352EF|nr:class I SAM-dependent methyltransferase [Pectobacterium polaris]MCA6940489.1 class I SAM-dependent methyltransferase [Pectobacterium polaris]MCA6957314.1 class I SAM-dependent methyltransferase [Pectobacterium polaris]
MLIDHKLYSEHWKKESDLMDSKGVYEKLAALTPEGNVLEFGCGAGQGTLHLLAHHSVLSLENNERLIEIATKHLEEHGYSPNIHQCDFFILSDSDKQVISDFAPKVIVGWLIGGSGEDQIKRVPSEPDAAEMSKKYRENIEDIIVSPSVCIDSVEYIQLASRGLGIAGADKNAVFSDTKADYDKFVFNPVGFEVVSVETMPWAHEESTFGYGQAHNPNFAGGKPVETIPLVTSILARRIPK